MAVARGTRAGRGSARPLRRRAGSSRRAATAEPSPVGPSAGTEAAATFTVDLPTEVARRQVRLGQAVLASGPTLFVEAVADGGVAEFAGVSPGQVLRAITHPVNEGLWELSGGEKLRDVRDAIQLSMNLEKITFVLDTDVTVTAAMVESAKPAPPAPAPAAAPQAPPPVLPPSAASENPNDRPDLYSDNWQGDVYTGSGWNELTVILAISIIVPVIGLVFALTSRGTLWDIPTY